MSVKLGSLVCIESVGVAASSSSPPATEIGQKRPAQDTVENEAPEARFADGLLAPPDVGDTAAVDAVAEPGQHRRQDGQRSDQRAEDDEHRSDGHSGEDAAARDEHAGHRDQHRGAGDQHRLSGGRGRPEERGARFVTAGALLPFPAEVEEGIVVCRQRPARPGSSSPSHPSSFIRSGPRVIGGRAGRARVVIPQLV